mmetsp:Transcript_5652/g.8943  ORF Transcript_5652/g.8943 Transcript_5652/m.8943 type:complete len:110 (+) Transcript_5652:4215-4544(+)
MRENLLEQRSSGTTDQKSMVFESLSKVGLTDPSDYACGKYDVDLKPHILKKKLSLFSQCFGTREEASTISKQSQIDDFYLSSKAYDQILIISSQKELASSSVLLSLISH